MTFGDIKDFPEKLKQEKSIKAQWFSTWKSSDWTTRSNPYYINQHDDGTELIYHLFDFSTDFCYVSCTLVYGKIHNDLRVIFNVSSSYNGWKSFKDYNTEWRRKDMTYEQFKTCIRNIQKIVHHIQCEEQRIQKSFKASLRKIGILKDTLEDV